MKSYSLKIALISAFLVLSACSGVDLNTNASDKSGGQAENVEPSIHAESMDGLPGCGKKREGVAAEVANEIYVCTGGRWEKQEASSDDVPQKAEVKNYESENDLPACVSKNEASFAIAGGYAFVCFDRKWENLGIYTASEDDLVNCTQSREGDKRYIADQGISYICVNERWEYVGDDTVSNIGSNSNMVPDPSYNPIMDPGVMYPYYSSSSAMTMPSFPVYSSSSVMFVNPIPVYSSSSVMIINPTPVYSSSSVAVVPTPTPVFSSSSAPKSSSSRARSSSSAKAKSSSSVAASASNVCGDMWCGTRKDGAHKEYRVETGLDVGFENAGYWWDYSDVVNGGESIISWPVAIGKNGDLSSVIDYCEGVCGSFVLDQGILEYSPYVGIAFNVAGYDEYEKETYTADATLWNGVCIVYKSDVAINLEMGLTDYVDQSLAYDVPAVSLPATKTVIMKQFKWSSFAQNGWGYIEGGDKMSGTTGASQLASLKFKISAKTGTTGSFNIISVGRYGTCK